MYKKYDSHQDFTSGTILLTTSVKEAWTVATGLALAAVEHYHLGKDTEGKAHDTLWVTDLAEAFSHMDTDFDKCFGLFILDATNIKLRQDQDDLSKPIYCITRGNRPELSGEFITSVEKNGLQKYAKGLGKSANKAKLMNRDGIKEIKDKVDTAATVTALKTSALGQQLVEAAEAADKMAGTKKKEAEKASEQFKATIAAIESGEPVPAFDIPSDMPDTDLARSAVESAQKLIDMAMASGQDTELDEKLEKLVVDTAQQFKKPHTIALGLLAKREISDDDDAAQAA